MYDGKKVVAFIPVRGGSKSIHMKNIKPLAGRPLVHWTILAALGCPGIDKLYVCTDAPAIDAACEEFKANPRFAVVGRSPEVSTDEASTESVVLEFLGTHEDFDTLILIQATSPLLRTMDLETGLKRFAEPEVDSVLSLVRQKRFVWKEHDGLVTPANYDYRKRPRRQEFDGILTENGAFYIISRENFLRDHCRLTGNIGFVEMDEASYYDIDEPSDFQIVDGLLRNRLGDKGLQRGANPR